jgi:hypothetical protein
MKRSLLVMFAALLLSAHAARAQSPIDVVRKALDDKESDGTAYLEPDLVAAFKHFVATGCEQIYSFSAWVDGPNRHLKTLRQTAQSAQVQISITNSTDIASVVKVDTGWKIHDSCGPNNANCYRAYLLKAKCE